MEKYFLHTRWGYPCVSPVPTNLILPMLSHPGSDKNHVHLMHWLYRKSRIYRRQVTLVFTTATSKNDVTFCKLDVNVKNRTAVAGSVDFFKLK